MDNTKPPKGPWKVIAQSATWDDNGDIIVRVEVTLPQKSISLPEGRAVGEFIAPSIFILNRRGREM
jgi:hypothetical protein